MRLGDIHLHFYFSYTSIVLYVKDPELTYLEEWDLSGNIVYEVLNTHFLSTRPKI